MKNVLTSAAKNFLLPLRRTAAASVTYAAIQKEIYGSGTTASIFSNKKLDDIIGIVKFLKDSGLLLKGVSETVEKTFKEQK